MRIKWVNVCNRTVRSRLACAIYVLVVNVVVMTTQFCDDDVQVEAGMVQFS